MNHRFLLAFIAFFFLYSFYYYYFYLEHFTSIRSPANYPCALDTVLLQDTYPVTLHPSISNHGADHIWWHYPIFLVGSYKQITNNIKYPNNPDQGTCMPASMCGTLYHDKKHWQDFVQPPSPLKNRVGFFNTYQTFIDNLPFRTNLSNILF